MTDADAGASAAAPSGTSLPPTERRLAASSDLDGMSTLERLRLLNAQDAVAVAAVGAVLPALAELVDLGVAALRAGGSVHYFGAGTSGRLAVLDAAELLPTYGLPSGVVTAHLAGGDVAVTRAVEGSEDSESDGAAAASGLGERDLAIGLAASGGTPYVGGALRAAAAAGAATALVSNNPHAPLAPLADRHLVLDTGAEVVTGSTRLKAGTAQKLLLNGFSTALMIELGRTWSNLMVAVVPTNEKLRRRTVRILREATGLDEPGARTALQAAGDDLRTAIVAELGRTGAAEAAEALRSTDGSVRAALRVLRG